jgi:hypothetical protein
MDLIEALSSRIFTYAMGRLEGVADIAWISVRPHHGRLLE